MAKFNSESNYVTLYKAPESYESTYKDKVDDDLVTTPLEFDSNGSPIYNGSALPNSGGWVLTGTFLASGYESIFEKTSVEVTVIDNTSNYFNIRGQILTSGSEELGTKYKRLSHETSGYDRWEVPFYIVIEPKSANTKSADKISIFQVKAILNNNTDTYSLFSFKAVENSAYSSSKYTVRFSYYIDDVLDTRVVLTEWDAFPVKRIEKLTYDGLVISTQSKLYNKIVLELINTSDDVNILKNCSFTTDNIGMSLSYEDVNASDDYGNKITIPTLTITFSSFDSSWRVNTESYQKTYSAILHSPNASCNLLSLLIYQQYEGLTGDDVVPAEDQEEIDASDVYTIIDYNEGEDQDATSLLFKGNSSNIYNTIELKDGTLFAGNFTNTNEQLYIYNKAATILDDAVRQVVTSISDIQDNTINLFETTENILIDSDDENYHPYLDRNSEKKHLFKKMETYLIGLVFKNEQGICSSVYYLQQWTPSLDPMSHTGYYTKPKLLIILSSDISSKLASEGITAIIPVYAIKDRHNVLAQGFITNGIDNHRRIDTENPIHQYSWFYRRSSDDTPIKLTYDAAGDSSDTTNQRFNSEILNIIQNTVGYSNRYKGLNFNLTPEWEINQEIFTMNSPEVECDTELTNAQLSSAVLRIPYVYTSLMYKNDLALELAGHYANSKLLKSDITKITDKRLTYGAYWYGFYNPYPRQPNEDDDWDDFIGDAAVTYREGNVTYANFFVYPWQRNRMGAEGPDYTITSKKWMSQVIASQDNTGIPSSQQASEKYQSNYDVNLDAIKIYRDFDTTSILKIDDLLYEGNTDYLSTTESSERYGVYAKLGNSTVGFYLYKKNDSYAGLIRIGDTDKVKSICNSQDPIAIKYKSAPHLVFKHVDGLTTYDEDGNIKDVDTNYNKLIGPCQLGTNLIAVAELYNNFQTEYDTPEYLQSKMWIKCGQQMPIVSNTTTTISFRDGDYFFGRFDSLRTYPYTQMDSNSIIEIVSGFLCSRINLDARTDLNRNILSSYVTNTNFNQFNKVYDLLPNYFTFTYLNTNDTIYQKKYVNSVQWSLTKTNGEEIDSWLNIQDANIIDLDGDKGELQVIKKSNNTLYCFQNKAVSQLLYNENVAATTTNGVPIEIANSGKVQGKRYLNETVGCQNKHAVTVTPAGIYFIDGLNKSIYLIGETFLDIPLNCGMKSWAINNLDSDWIANYDQYSLEVIFSNPEASRSTNDSGFDASIVGTGENCILFDEPHKKFQCFASYGNVEHYFSLNGRTFIHDINKSLSRPVLGMASSSISLTTYTFKGFSLYMKNVTEDTSIMNGLYKCEIELIANPEYTKCKTFTNFEYRADYFLNGEYLPNNTFKKFRVTTEYQDTGDVVLTTKGVFNGVESINFASNLKKKFRIWNIDIPRSQTYTLNGRSYSRDRITNMWCKVKLSDQYSGAKIVFHDCAISYIS